MTAFDCVKALDEGSAVQEFSKAVFWSWADQSEIAIETIEGALKPDKDGKIAWQQYLDKVKEFKIASSALGVVQVSKTLANMIRVVHPAEKKERAYSYRASYDEDELTEEEVAARLQETQDLALERAKALLATLSEQVKQAIEWFEDHYKPKPDAAPKEAEAPAAEAVTAVA